MAAAPAWLPASSYVCSVPPLDDEEAAAEATHRRAATGVGEAEERRLGCVKAALFVIKRGADASTRRVEQDRAFAISVLRVGPLSATIAVYIVEEVCIKT